MFLVIGLALPRGMHTGGDLSWKEWLFEDVFQCLRIRLILSCRSITFWLQLPPGNPSSACMTFYSRYCHHTVFLSTTNSQLCSHVAAAGRVKLITSWHQLLCNTCWIRDCSQHYVLLAMALLAKSRFSDYICMKLVPARMITSHLLYVYSGELNLCMMQLLWQVVRSHSKFDSVLMTENHKWPALHNAFIHAQLS